MEPRIQYARTDDGVNIAFWTLGEGQPLVHMSGTVTHCQLEWEIPECRRWYEALALRHRLVVFDARGIGLSDRKVNPTTTEENLKDLEAVVERLGLRSFSIFAAMHSAPVAIMYATRCPERVSRLIVWGGYATTSEWAERPAIEASRSLIEKD